MCAFPTPCRPRGRRSTTAGRFTAHFTAYNSASSPPPASSLRDVVVVKDLNWGASSPAFQALVDSGDGQVGVRVATRISNPWYNSNFEDPCVRQRPVRSGAHHRGRPQRRRPDLPRLHDRDIGGRRDIASALVERRRPELVRATFGPFRRPRTPASRSTPSAWSASSISRWSAPIG